MTYAPHFYHQANIVRYKIVIAVAGENINVGKFGKIFFSSY